MKVGDLVKIAPHCKNKGRLAIVVETFDWDARRVRIVFCDGKGFLGVGNTSKHEALMSNLEVISESR